VAIHDEFIIERQGKRMVLYSGLLQEAHGKGLRSIETELLRFEMDDQGEPIYAVVKAVARTEDGKFEGIGDATRKNVGRNIVPHLIRQAETRAKARALRDAINVGMTALEEMDDADDSGERHQKPARDARRAQEGRRASSGSPDTNNVGTDHTGQPRGSNEACTPEQRREITELADDYFEDGLRELQQKVLKNQPVARLSPEKADQLIATLKRKIEERDRATQDGEAEEADDSEEVEVDFDDEDFDEVERIAEGSGS